LLAIGDGAALQIFANFPARLLLTHGSDSIHLLLFCYLLGCLFGTTCCDEGAKISLPREGFVFGGIVGRQVGKGNAQLVQQLSGFGEFVAEYIRLAIRPAQGVGGQGVVLGLVEFAKRLPEPGKVAIGETTIGDIP